MSTNPASRLAACVLLSLLHLGNSKNVPNLWGSSRPVGLLHRLASDAIPLFCACLFLFSLVGCASTPQSIPVVKDPLSTSEYIEPIVGPEVAASSNGTEIQVAEISTASAAETSIQPFIPTSSLWERIRRGFAMPNLENPLVDESTQWYVSRPDYLTRMTLRSQKYLFHVVEELERRHMPTELALLPFVESAFNPQAVSSAKAAGMWQFIPSTGLTFDLKQNIFRDDRRDVLASTRAALDYLQKLYGMFGDWHLTLAGYNWGEGSVLRAIKQNQRLGLGARYVDLRMPKETQYYVPRLQAVKNLVTDPQAHGIQLPEIGNHPYFRSVALKRDIDVALAARFSEISHDEFKALNPSANRPVILAAGTPQILVPWENADAFERNLRSHQGRQIASWTAWVVPSTMTPSMAAIRAGMTESELRSVNKIPSGKSARAGSTLVIKRKSTVWTDVSDHLADSAQLELVKTLRKVQRPAKTKSAPTTPKNVSQGSRKGRTNSAA